MRNCFLTCGALVTPFGKTADEAWTALLDGKSAIRLTTDAGFNQTALPIAACPFISDNRYNELLQTALEELLKTHSDLPNSAQIAVIVSSTKGNLDDIDTDSFASTRKIIAEKLGNLPLTIVSNACISGVMAVNLAADYIRSGEFVKVVIIGIDAVSEFVSFGFQSLFALSDETCKPFDKTRNGTSLGEACAILVMSAEKPASFAVEYINGSSSNDANHISGPSRTGEGLYRAIQRTFQRSGVVASDIDFISAHGTATLYNDEMESIAFGRCELDQKPIHSLKGYFGHTLGAAGVLETFLAVRSMEMQLAIRNLNFSETGTSVVLNIQQSNEPANIQYLLKTASGFGGGNAACLLKLISE